MRLIWPWQDRQRRFSWLKASAFVLVLLPGIRLTYQTVTGEFGLLAMAFGGLTYWSGVWATVVLLMALAVTPMIVVFRWPALGAVPGIDGGQVLVVDLVHGVCRDPATFELAALGRDSIICRLEEKPERNVERWKKMPVLADFQEVGEAKPGAVTLAEVDLRANPLSPTACRALRQRLGAGVRYGSGPVRVARPSN